jgi:hypothetical protein
MMLGFVMVCFIGGAEIPGTPGLVCRVIGISGGVLMMSGVGLMVWHINRLEKLEKKERVR